jgi:hypothetical protein
MQQSTKPVCKPTYNLKHESLPYEIERSLPYPVIDSIYSFLRPKVKNTALQSKKERYEIEINHRISALKEKLYERKVRREKKEKARKDLIASLDRIIGALERSLQ